MVSTQTKPNGKCHPVSYKFFISRCSCYYMGCLFHNEIPASLAQTAKMSSFKSGAKKWVMDRIPLQPP